MKSILYTTFNPFHISAIIYCPSYILFLTTFKNNRAYLKWYTVFSQAANYLFKYLFSFPVKTIWKNNLFYILTQKIIFVTVFLLL